MDQTAENARDTFSNRNIYEGRICCVCLATCRPVVALASSFASWPLFQIVGSCLSACAACVYDCGDYRWVRRGRGRCAVRFGEARRFWDMGREARISHCAHARVGRAGNRHLLRPGCASGPPLGSEPISSPQRDRRVSFECACVCACVGPPSSVTPSSVPTDRLLRPRFKSSAGCSVLRRIGGLTQCQKIVPAMECRLVKEDRAPMNSSLDERLPSQGSSSAAPLSWGRQDIEK